AGAGGPGGHSGEFGGVGAAAEVEGPVTGDAGGQLPFAGASGHHHPVSGVGEFGDRLRAPSGAPGAGGDAGAGVDDDVAGGAGQRPGGRRRQDPQPAVVGAREPGGGGEVQRGLGLVGVRVPVVAHVEGGAGVVLAVGGDAADAGQAQQQGGGQRGLVEGGEDEGGAGLGGGDPADERVDVVAPDRGRPEPGPGGVPDEDLVDAGQEPGGGRAERPAQQGDVVGAGRDGAHRGPGEQHVAEAVEPGDEGLHVCLPSAGEPAGGVPPAHGGPSRTARTAAVRSGTA